MNDNKVKGSEKVSERPQNKNLKPFKKGQSGNPKGMKVGTRPYKVLFREAVIKLAKAKGLDPVQFELDLIARGIEMMGKDFRFYKDSLDRLHGAPKQAVDVTSDGERVTGFALIPPEPPLMP